MCCRQTCQQSVCLPQFALQEIRGQESLTPDCLHEEIGIGLHLLPLPTFQRIIHAIAVQRGTRWRVGHALPPLPLVSDCGPACVIPEAARERPFLALGAHVRAKNNTCRFAAAILKA